MEAFTGTANDDSKFEIDSANVLTEQDKKLIRDKSGAIRKAVDGVYAQSQYANSLPAGERGDSNMKKLFAKIDESVVAAPQRAASYTSNRSSEEGT